MTVVVRLIGGGTREVEAVRVGPYAVHRTVGVPWGYSITQIETGESVTPRPFETEADAVRGAHTLARAALGS